MGGGRRPPARSDRIVQTPSGTRKLDAVTPSGPALALPGYVADLLAWILHPCRAGSGGCFWRRNGAWGYGTPNPADSPGEVGSILATDTRTRGANVCPRLQILSTPFLLPKFLKALNSHFCHPQRPLLPLPPPFPKALGSGSFPSLPGSLFHSYQSQIQERGSPGH